MLVPRRPLAVIALVLMLPLPAAADPPAWSGAWQVHERYHRPDLDDSGAPVPFVAEAGPAGAEGEVPVARGLPYGFNRGTCDHSLLQAAATRELAVGGVFGQAMTAPDRECLWGAVESLPDNRAIAWVGENGTLFRVSTERTYMKQGTACRDWRGSAAQPGASTQTFGTFCRRSDGQWVSAR